MNATARAPDAAPRRISTIGEDLSICGCVTSKGELHLNGQVQGDVHCVALVLGEKAQLEGNVVAEDVMVRGRLIGSVRALTVTLQANSHVEGNLLCKSLSLEQGTHFEGESHPSEDPLAFGADVFAVEFKPLDKKCPESGKPRDRVNGFIRSLPEARNRR
jgi:cytoskeletal protein CcmA (bactofilin family)